MKYTFVMFINRVVSWWPYMHKHNVAMLSKHWPIRRDPLLPHTITSQLSEYPIKYSCTAYYYIIHHFPTPFPHIIQLRVPPPPKYRLRHSGWVDGWGLGRFYHIKGFQSHIKVKFQWRHREPQSCDCLQALPSPQSFPLYPPKLSLYEESVFTAIKVSVYTAKEK